MNDCGATSALTHLIKLFDPGQFKRFWLSVSIPLALHEVFSFHEGLLCRVI